MEVLLSNQIVSYLRHLPPQPKRRIRLALKTLSQGKGDIKHLQGNLERFSRLRAGDHRAIFALRSNPKGPVADCLNVDRRRLVYEVFAHTSAERLKKI